MTGAEAIALIGLIRPIATELVPEIAKLLNGLGGTGGGGNPEIDKVRFESDLIHATNVATDKLLRGHGHDPQALRAIINAGK